MAEWPAIAVVAFLMFLGVLIWARLAEGRSNEFATYTIAKKMQTLALIYAGCFVAVAVGWGIVLIVIRPTSPGIDYY